jgi:predicted RNA-binding protein YlxR (DUF448 family)
MSMPRPESGRKKSKPVRQKHVPIRTCVSCREAGAKRGLIRIVRTPEGHDQIDPTGRKNGRGAYLCYKQPCWQRATQTPILNRALNTQLSSESLSTLSEFAAGLPSDEVLAAAADSSEETHE